MNIEAIFFKDWNNSFIPEILEEIYIKEIYKPFLFGKKDLTIVDIGANIGLASYYFKNFGKVYSVEPAQSHLETLNKMIEFNKITNITVCPCAISNKTGKQKFYHLPNTTAHSLELIANPNDFEEVEIVDFEEFMTRNKLEHIDLLKMDSEGEEGKIFTSDSFKKYAPKIKVIVGEYHEWCNMGKNQFANTLIDLGYKFNWLPNMKASVFTAIRL
jgi:FkbM family methyltransferase